MIDLSEVLKDAPGSLVNLFELDIRNVLKYKETTTVGAKFYNTAEELVIKSNSGIASDFIVTRSKTPQIVVNTKIRPGNGFLDLTDTPLNSIVAMPHLLKITIYYYASANLTTPVSSVTLKSGYYKQSDFSRIDFTRYVIPTKVTKNNVTTNIGEVLVHIERLLYAEVVRFTPFTSEVYGNVYFDNEVYVPYPIILSGLEYSGKGSLPSPKMQVSNIDGYISALCMSLDSMLGSKLSRLRTVAKYLDYRNFKTTDLLESVPLNTFTPTACTFTDEGTIPGAINLTASSSSASIAKTVALPATAMKGDKFNLELTISSRPTSQNKTIVPIIESTEYTCTSAITTGVSQTFTFTRTISSARSSIPIKITFPGLVNTNIIKVHSVKFYAINRYEDGSAKLPTETFFVDRKSAENIDLVEFELTSLLELTNVLLPRRLIIDRCPFAYKGTDCGWVPTVNNTSTDITYKLQYRLPTGTQGTLDVKQVVTKKLLPVDTNSYRLTLNDYTVTRTGVTNSPANLTVTSNKWTVGASVGTASNAFFKVYFNGLSDPSIVTSTANSVLTFSTALATREIRVEAYSDNAFTKLLSLIEVPVGVSGETILNPFIYNSKHTLPCTGSGVVSNYKASGTALELYYGATKLTATSSTTLANGTFRLMSVTTSGAALTIGSSVTSGTTLVVANHSAMVDGNTTLRYFTSNNSSTSDPTEDYCSKELKACELRFGQKGVRYGGFPGAGTFK